VVRKGIQIIRWFNSLSALRRRIEGRLFTGRCTAAAGACEYGEQDANNNGDIPDFFGQIRNVPIIGVLRKGGLRPSQIAPGELVADFDLGLD